MMFSIRSLLAGLFLAVLVAVAEAVPLSVDFSQSTDVPLQAGFVGFSGNSTATITNNYAADFGTGGGGTVSVTISGNTHYRDYPAITSGSFVGESALLSDSVLRNEDGTMTLTLDDIADGMYEITTYHHGTSFGNGVFDVLLSDANGSDMLIADNFMGTGGTSPMDIATLTFDFVSDGSPVEIDIVGGGPNNHAQLNGFVLEQIVVPEPASIALWSLLGMLTVGGFVWRRKIR